MDSFPPAHGPARRVEGLLGDLEAGTDEDVGPDGPPPDLPEVVEAVTERARDLHRLADRLTAEAAGAVVGGEHADTGTTEGTTLWAVARLRAHAGAVDDLAEHLLAAGHGRCAGDAPEATRPSGPDVAGPAAGAAADPAGPAGPGPLAPGPRGVPRSVG